MITYKIAQNTFENMFLDLDLNLTNKEIYCNLFLLISGIYSNGHYR